MNTVQIKDIRLAKALREMGHGLIHNFLAPADIQRLRSFFYDSLSEASVDAPFFTTHWSPSVRYRNSVDDFVREQLLPLSENHFDGYKCMLGYFLFKRPGEGGAVSLHRDWSLTDEAQHSGLILWIPLTDINKGNGGFQLVENSHTDAPVRGTNIHPPVPKDITSVEIYPAAGDALVMDNRLMHASQSNLSNEDRLVAGLILIPKKAEILHYFKKDEVSGKRTIRVGNDFLRNSFFNYENPLSTEHLNGFTDTSEMHSTFSKGKKQQRVFKDDALQERFEKFGYVIIKDFLEKDTIAHLWDVYRQNADVVTDKSFFISQWSNKREHKDRINQEVQKALVPRAQKYLNSYEPVFAVFGVKHPKADSGMYLHQDWSHVDETYFRTVNVWCPLLNLTPEHGPVQILKGSHRLFDTWRGVDIPDSFLDIGEERLKSYLSDIILEAGDVVMWDHRVIHGSGINTTGTSRVAAIVNMKPKDSKFYLFYADSYEDVKEVEVFEPPSDFFTANDSANEPSLVKERAIFCHHFPYKRLRVSEEQLKQFLKEEFDEEEHEPKLE